MYPTSSTSSNPVHVYLFYLWIDRSIDRSPCRYYDSLFKEYAVASLAGYRENRIGLRWRTADEVMAKKGQEAGSCGEVTCDEKDQLATFEVQKTVPLPRDPSSNPGILTLTLTLTLTPVPYP